MNAYDNLQSYLNIEMDVLIERPAEEDDEEFGYYDAQLKELILQYGQEQRKEGYKKGFNDAEIEAAQTMDGS